MNRSMLWLGSDHRWCCLPAARGAGAAARRTRDDGGRDLRRRLLLVRRIRFRQGAGRDLDHLRLYRRQGRQSDLRAGLGRRHRPRRGGARSIYDPAKVTLPASCSTCSGATSIRLAKDRQFCDHGDQYRTRDLRPQRRAAAARRGLEEEGRGAIQEADLHRDRRRRAVLPGRGLSPGFLPEEPDPDTNSTAGTAAAISGWSSCGARSRQELTRYDRTVDATC